MGDRSAGTLPMWQVVGFSGEQEAMLIANVCAGKQKYSSGKVTELPKSQAIFVDGVTATISPLAISAILKLSSILDCSQKRLSSIKLQRQHSTPDELVRTCIKHEIVEQVKIDKDRTIHIKLRMRYRYPARYGDVGEVVREELKKDIRDAQEPLKACGIVMPAPQFYLSQSLFLEEHPHISSDEKV